jgi:copper chaperone CopZ
MTEAKIYIPDIECESCTKVLNKRFKNMDSVHEYTVNEDSVDVNYDSNKLKVDEILSMIHESGFRASLRPFERKNFGERWRDFKENTHKYSLLLRGAAYALWAFIILLALEAAAYFGFLNSIPNFVTRYALWILYADISIAALGAAVWYIASYRSNITHMVGMMLGMTVGMQTGLLLGAVIGATNGFFTGAMVGMLAGVIAGVAAGKCCGVMGMMEGAMAGVMGGTMGPMISLMMFTDRIKIFMPFYVVINLLILVGMMYMYFEEVIENRKNITRTNRDFVTFASACVIITCAITVIMLYGPKSALFGG